MPEVDPQKVRGGQLRLNHATERQDGRVVLVHPGTRPRNDANPILLTAKEFQLRITEHATSSFCTATEHALRVCVYLFEYPPWRSMVTKQFIARIQGSAAAADTLENIH